MNVPKLCLRVAVFLCTLTFALFVTRLFLVPTRVEVTIQPPSALEDAEQSPIALLDRPVAPFLDTKLVELDCAAHVAHVKLVQPPYVLGVNEAANHNGVRAEPEHIWVWTYFFSPDVPGKVWASAPVEVPTRLNSPMDYPATIDVTVPCDWCVNVLDITAHNFYARTRISASAAGARLAADHLTNVALPATELDFDIRTATPVVVKHEFYPQPVTRYIY